MAWWSRLFSPKAESSLFGLEYRTAFTLYSRDGRREVEVRAFSNGETYVLEREMDQANTFQDRHSGSMVGPFANPEEAERFIVGTAWFSGK